MTWIQSIKEDKDITKLTSIMSERPGIAVKLPPTAFKV